MPRPPSRWVETDGGLVEVRQVHPFQATKTYRCPGCNQEVHPGVGHVVVVPVVDAAARRHWHRPCWERGHGRRAGRP